MATDVKKNYAVNELDQIRKQFEQTKISPKDDNASDNEEEPQHSSNSPDQREHHEKPEMVEEDGRRVMFVAAKSRVKLVAGSIARTIREEENKEQIPPMLSAVGAASVNQAVKAIAIARDFVEEQGIDLVVELSRRPTKEVKDVIVLALRKVQRGSLLKEGDDSDLYVDMKSAGNSMPKALAGAIAMNIRGDKYARITCIGQKPVFKAVYAIALARRFVFKEGMDLDMVPQFTQVKFDNGSDANAIQLIVIPRKI